MSATNDNGRRCAGNASHVVMFREPKAPIALPFRMLCQVKRVPERVRRGGASGNECEIKNREARHSYIYSAIKKRALPRGATPLEAAGLDRAASPGGTALSWNSMLLFHPSS